MAHWNLGCCAARPSAVGVTAASCWERPGQLDKGCRLLPSVMSLSPAQLEELTQALADRIYLQVAGWNLYLGDAKLARPLAEELAAVVDQGAAAAVRQALERLQVPLGGGSTRLPLARLIPPGQLVDLEEVVESLFS